jgi:hypothetical protein
MGMGRTVVRLSHNPSFQNPSVAGSHHRASGYEIEARIYSHYVTARSDCNSPEICKWSTDVFAIFVPMWKRSDIMAIFQGDRS